MISLLSKPAEQIDIADIQELIDSEVPESEQIEYKESLPTDDGSLDRWVTHGDRIGRRAKQKILEESVAFANAYGGALVLGIAESEATPPVADRITPVTACVDLAERLKQVFRDSVDPQIPSLEIFAVPTDGNSGVTIIRVEKSRMAPHRVEPTRRCTIRRSDRCDPMSMREIQDLTLNTRQGMDRVEHRLSQRSKGYLQEFGRLSTPNEAFGIRATAIPVGNDILFERVYGRNELYRPPFQISWLDNTSTIAGNHPSSWRPILRGERSDSGLHEEWTVLAEDWSRYSYEEVHSDGLVEVVELSCSDTLNTGRVVAVFASVLIWADTIRNVASKPISEFAVDFEIFANGRDLSLAGGASHRSFHGVFQGEKFGRLRRGLTGFPRYSLSESDEIPMLAALFEQDLWDAVGKDVKRVSCTLHRDDDVPRLTFEYENQA